MIPAVDGLAAFGAATVAAGLIAGYLVVGEPVAGAVLHRRFEASLRHDVGARLWLYRRLLVLEWGLVALVVGVVLIAPSVGWAQLGLRLPDRAPSVTAVALVVLVLGFLLVSTRALRISARRHPEQALSVSAAATSVTALVPRTRVERRWFGLVSVTAGFCEELLYRGFLFAVVVALVPGISDLALVVVGGLVFGVAHAYQGLGGVVTTSVLGAILAALYVGTGTVLVPMLVHAAVDLRILWVPAGLLPPDRSSA